jgi:hypothetical protein
LISAICSEIVNLANNTRQIPGRKKMAVGNLGQRWAEYRASKATLFWACVGSIVATIVIGFSWGGWTTGGSAEEMASEAAEQAREQLAAAVCVERFTQGAEARSRLSSFQGLSSSYERSNFIRDGAWAIMPGSDEASYGAARTCAEELVTVELPPATVTEQAAEPTTVVQ